MNYNPLNWYWLVGNNTTQVWSSASQSYVPVSDATYTAWTTNAKATKIDTLENLLAVVAPYLLMNGVQLTSTSTPALDGAYACDLNTQLKITAVSQYIAINSAFPGGGDTYPWLDMSGSVHTFPSVAGFQQFATAIADYVAGLDLAAMAQATSLPSPAVSIP